MADVINIADHKPHVCVVVENGDAHVLPVSLITDWANGNINPNPDVLKSIILEWLSMIGK